MKCRRCNRRLKHPFDEVDQLCSRASYPDSKRTPCGTVFLNSDAGKICLEGGVIEGGAEWQVAIDQWLERGGGLKKRTQ